MPLVAVGTIETLVSKGPHVTSLFKINNRIFNYVSLNMTWDREISKLNQNVYILYVYIHWYKIRKVSFNRNVHLDNYAQKYILTYLYYAEL